MAANPFSLYFSTGTYYLTLGSGRILGALTNASVAMYFKPTGGHGGNGGTLYCERSATGNDIWKLQTTGPSSNILQFTHRDTAGTLNQPSASTNLSLNTWYHVVMTKVGTAIKFYVNGIQDGSTGTLTGTDTLTNASPVTRVALDVADGSSALTGKTDEILLFNSGLSASEVLALYSAGTIPAGLIDRYSCNEGTGTAVGDSVGSNAGVLSNSLIWSSDAPTLPGIPVNAYAGFF